MKKIYIIISFILFISFLYILSIYNGFLLLNNPSKSKYPIRGIDVSHYQGNIDWEVLSSQNIQFAYIKATEGSSHVDNKFLYNWEHAKNTTLKIGAYHFFSFDSPAENQAKNFIENVSSFKGMLPPVIDIEFYNNKKKNPPDIEIVSRQLQIMLNKLEKHYHLRPIIYTTEDLWKIYIKDQFSNYPLWIRNVQAKPNIENYNWTFWQYTNREKLKGYKGKEKFIDMNVFYGNIKDWEDWLNKSILQ